MMIPESQLLLRSSAVAAGGTDDELARLRRRGLLQPLQRGAYVPPDVLAELDQAGRHRLKIQAAVAALRRPAVISHTSAAILHGIPLWGAGLGPVQITRNPPSSSDRGARLRVHVARLEKNEICQVDGTPVTNVTRTLLDLGRTLSFESAVVATDFALHGGIATVPALADAALDVRGIPGSLQASRVIAFANGASESVGESRSRVAIARLGLTAPTLQLAILDDSQRLIGVSDFGWSEDSVIGEFDGRVKYGRLLKPGQSPGDAVFAEKRREDAIRDQGWEVVRWIWDDLATPGVIAQRIRRAQERARRRR
ncbi:MAG: hypothetical protein M3381_15460 [Actinomycetota bacterium]|nr:hypothetical protein [Actinomycetota bacterium]